jgi:arylsulfatase A-like enzyme
MKSRRPYCLRHIEIDAVGREQNMNRTIALVLIGMLTWLPNCKTLAAERPNILWITAEDMSPTLGCYGDEYSTTPNIDAFAKRSLKYPHAFASAPVCSPSRSCLIHGVMATSLGTQQMRSANPIPSYMQGFPSLLRKAGYFTSNNVKTDYNCGNWKEIIEASWDAQNATAHWRQRPANKPFFSIFNLMTSHQSRTMVWPYEKFQTEIQRQLSPDEIHNPAKAPIPPYYPDTPIVRQTVARFYDCVTVMDKQVGELLSQLEADGLADDTIVFFYSDHGSGMPRHKRALLDSGMHIPMLVHVPQKWQRFANAKPNTSTDRLVSFPDFAPTVLNIAGIEIPPYMQGRPFLGKETTPSKIASRRFVFGHRDRVDEVFDLARSVRSQRFLYIRNFMPHLGYNQRTSWPDQGAIRHEFYSAAAGGRLTVPQQHFMSPTRPSEELYDCQRDPLNLVNLAKSPDHQDVLKLMRRALRRHVIESKDLGFIPEAFAWKWSAGKTAYDKARESYDVSSVFAAACDIGYANEAEFRKHLGSTNPAIRYWGAMGLTAKTELSPESFLSLKAGLNDDSISVRVQCADALCRHSKLDLGLPILAQTLEHKNLIAVLHAARTIELLGREAESLSDAIRRTDLRMNAIFPPDTPPSAVEPGEMDTAMFIKFSTSAFLTRLN